MRMGIIALALIFFASGAKNLQDAGVQFPWQKKTEETQNDKQKKDRDPNEVKKQAPYSRRKLGFGVLLLLMGALVLIYDIFA